LFLLYININKNIFSNNNKIAFLFLIYDEINHEEIWKHFFNKYKLDNIIPTTYYDISLVKAHNLLLEEALKDENNTHFILLSNSCIPFKNFNYIYYHLDNNFSYYNMCYDTLYERTTYALKYITKSEIKKAHQWAILNKKHATILIDDKNKYINWFTQCPDEHSHITYLFYKKLDNEIIKTNNSKYDATTFTNWDHNGLKNYDYIDTNELLLLYKSPCFFGRKFIKNCKNLDLLY